MGVGRHELRALFLSLIMVASAVGPAMAAPSPPIDPGEDDEVYTPYQGEVTFVSSGESAYLAGNHHDDDDQGPPDHAGPPEDDESDDEDSGDEDDGTDDSSNGGDGDDDDQGPPDHAGPPEDDDGSNDDDDGGDGDTDDGGDDGDTDDEGESDGESGGDSDDGDDSDDDDTDDDESGDGDRWWDGWIGVYDVGYSENVILYRHHLEQTGGGIRGDQIVQEQISIHKAWNAPSPTGAELYDNGTYYHSNVHMGELHWETDPTDISDTPEPTIRIEIDYDAESHDALRSEEWREAIVENYALYGIRIEFVDDEHTDILNGGDLCDGLTCMAGDHRSPYELDDLNWTQQHYHDTESLYMFVGATIDDPDHEELGPWQSGLALRHPADSDESSYVAVFSDGIAREENFEEIPADRLELDTDEQVRAMAHKTAVHEIGHVLRAGEADDTIETEFENKWYVYPTEVYVYNEVYSGGGEDDTVERVPDRELNQNVEIWSVMSAGTSRPQYLPPTNETYFVFSIEELFTVSTGDQKVDK